MRYFILFVSFTLYNIEFSEIFIFASRHYKPLKYKRNEIWIGMADRIHIGKHSDIKLTP